MKKNYTISSVTIPSAKKGIKLYIVKPGQNRCLVKNPPAFCGFMEGGM